MTRAVRTGKKEARRVFLVALSQGYSVTGAAQQAKVGRMTVYDWRARDQAFAAAWEEAWESGGDWYEDQNREQARQGQMPAILNGLRLHQRLVERQEVQTQHSGEVVVKVVYDGGRD